MKNQETPARQTPAENLKNTGNKPSHKYTARVQLLSEIKARPKMLSETEKQILDYMATHQKQATPKQLRQALPAISKTKLDTEIRDLTNHWYIETKNHKTYKLTPNGITAAKKHQHQPAKQLK